MKRIGILTNAAATVRASTPPFAALPKSLYEEFGNDVEIYGIKDGYKGLIFG